MLKNILQIVFKSFILLVPFLLTVRLSFTYCVLLPALLIFIIGYFHELVELYKSNTLIKYLHIFLFVAFVSSSFGLNSGDSYRGLSSLFLYSFSILLFEWGTLSLGPQKLIYSVLLGQTLMGVHSLLESGSSYPIPRVFIGAVTESGQIALTLPLGCALIVYLSRKYDISLKNNKKILIPLIASIFIISLIAFARFMTIPSYIFWVATGVLLVVVLKSMYDFIKYLLTKRQPFSETRFWQKSMSVIFLVCLPVIFFALLANLKRGPWFGVFIALTILFSFYRKKIAWSLCLIIPCIILSVTPLRERLQNSFEDFNISGGRNIMWQVGGELATRYPLGIGFANSEYQQKFAAEIPTSHRHFHNNFINILVECGWIAFFAFIFWLIKIFQATFFHKISSPERILQVGCGCSVVAMFCAGFVEYNFGDSEVLLLLFFILGILSALIKKKETDTSLMS